MEKRIYHARLLAKVPILLYESYSTVMQLRNWAYIAHLGKCIGR